MLLSESSLPHTAMPRTLWKARLHEKGILWLATPPWLPAGMLYTAQENSATVGGGGVVLEGRFVPYRSETHFLPNHHLLNPHPPLCRPSWNTPLLNEAGASKLLGKYKRLKRSHTVTMVLLARVAFLC